MSPSGKVRHLAFRVCRILGQMLSRESHIPLKTATNHHISGLGLQEDFLFIFSAAEVKTFSVQCTYAAATSTPYFYTSESAPPTFDFSLHSSFKYSSSSLSFSRSALSYANNPCLLSSPRQCSPTWTWSLSSSWFVWDPLSLLPHPNPAFSPVNPFFSSIFLRKQTYLGGPRSSDRSG